MILDKEVTLFIIQFVFLDVFASLAIKGCLQNLAIEPKKT